MEQNVSVFESADTFIEYCCLSLRIRNVSGVTRYRPCGVSYHAEPRSTVLIDNVVL